MIEIKEKIKNSKKVVSDILDAYFIELED